MKKGLAESENSVDKKSLSGKENRSASCKNDRFPPSLFAVYLGVLLLMSGIHTGLIVGMNQAGWNNMLQIVVPVIYWSIVAVGLTLFTRSEIKKHYEAPMHKLADATRKVAGGDFSVYVPTIHTADKLDYLDIMLMDFNKMVEELGSIETLKTDFFSNVSHEFKTPLSVIYNNALLLQLEDLSEQQREYVNSIIDSSKRMSNLIYNMLRLNMLEKQTISPMAEKYDVCAQLCECAVQFEEAWEKKNIELEVDMQEDSAFICADEALMAHVWNNLLSNAIKFTPEGGTVILRQTSDVNEVRIVVSDTGCGMSEDVRKRIFDKFYQGDTSHATEGNGLGLALVKRIIELSNATISVESTPGKGSAFSVVFPAVKTEGGVDQ